MQLRATCDVIVAAAVRFGIERGRSERARRLLAASDAMVAELEALNLLELDRLDAGCLLRLEELLRNLPFACDASPRADLSPTEALDLLFDLQRGLLAVKNGGRADERDWLLEDWEDD